MIASVLLFGLAIFVISLLISKRACICEKGEIATYVALIAWGSMVFGLFISKLAV
jgi:hypothetical protein